MTDRNTHTQTQRQAVGIELSLTIVDSLAYICDGFLGMKAVPFCPDLTCLPSPPNPPTWFLMEFPRLPCRFMEDCGKQEVSRDAILETEASIS